MIQRDIVFGAILGALVLGAVTVAQGSARSKDACANPAVKAELTAARRALDSAIYDVQAALSGGSLYAGAKIAAADPVEVQRATQRQQQAFERLQQARTDCDP